jgi:hypothetical protein
MLFDCLEQRGFGRALHDRVEGQCDITALDVSRVCRMQGQRSAASVAFDAYPSRTAGQPVVFELLDAANTVSVDIREAEQWGSAFIRRLRTTRLAIDPDAGEL